MGTDALETQGPQVFGAQVGGTGLTARQKKIKLIRLGNFDGLWLLDVLI